jgi:hypothetical protein
MRLVTPEEHFSGLTQARFLQEVFTSHMHHSPWSPVALQFFDDTIIP